MSIDSVFVNNEGIITDVIKSPGENIFIDEDGNQLWFNDPDNFDNWMAHANYSGSVGDRLYHTISTFKARTITDDAGLLDYWH